MKLSREFQAKEQKEQIEVKIDSQISELIIIESGKDPPTKIYEIGEWYKIEIKKHKDA